MNGKAGTHSFKAFCITFIDKDNHFNILLMVKEKKCIGAQAFFLYKPRKAAYQTYIGLDRNVKHHGPLYIILSWELIKWAEKNGYR